MTTFSSLRQTVAGFLAIAIISVNAFAFAAVPTKTVGEVLIADRGAKVTVNGELAQNGRSLFSGSTIDTPADSGAVVSIGGLGKLELAPGSSITLTFDDARITGALASGKVTVISASEKVEITANGSTASLGAGESAESGTTQDTTASASDNNSWWIWAAVFGGAIVGVVIATTSDNNRTAIGGGTTVVSPTR